MKSCRRKPEIRGDVDGLCDEGAAGGDWTECALLLYRLICVLHMLFFQLILPSWHPIVTVTEGIYTAEGFHYVLVHVTGIVHPHSNAIPQDDITDAAWVSSSGTHDDWARTLPGGVVVPQTGDVVTRATQLWRRMVE